MDPIELGSTLECEDGKMFAPKYDNGIPGTVQYVRIQAEILPKLITTNSANIDHYVLFKNDSQTIKPQKSVLAKPNPPTIIPKSPNSTQNTTTPTRKVKTRDEKRRFQHNQIERARREKINNWIMELGKIIPETFSNDNNLAVNSSNNNKSPGEALSKGGILEKACEYIQHLKSTNSELNESLQTHHSPFTQYQQNKQSLEIKRLLDDNEKLKLENAMLKRKLTRLNVDVVDDIDIDLGKKLKRDHDEPLSCVQFVD